MDLRIVSTIGTTEPVTLQEAKTYIRVTNAEEDTLVESMIENARMHVEKYIHSDIVSKQRALFLPYMDQPINLPYAPVTQIDSILQDGTTLTTDDYSSDGLDNPLVSIGGAGFSFSSAPFRMVPQQNVQITYTTTGVANAQIKQAVLCCVAWLYHGRDAKMNTNWKAFASPFRINGYYGNS